MFTYTVILRSENVEKIDNSFDVVQRFSDARQNANGFVSFDYNIVNNSTIILTNKWNSFEDYENFLSNNASLFVEFTNNRNNQWYLTNTTSVTTYT